MSSYAVTGASRGLGFALVKELSADPSNVVFGLVRNTEATQDKVSKELPERENIHIIHGDLSDISSLQSAAKYVAATTGGSLDMLIANAAIVKINFKFVDEEIADNLAEFDEDLLYGFKVNVMGNIHLMSIFTPLIKRGAFKTVAVLSSAMGDAGFVADVGVKMQTPYAISKAGLNMAVAKFHVQYKDEGILFMVISPGLVDTGGYDVFEKTPEFLAGQAEMGAKMKEYGGPEWKGFLTPEESSKLVLGVAHNATIEKNGGKMVSHWGTTRWL